MNDMTVAQRRILATSSLLTECNKASHDYIGGVPRPGGSMGATWTMSRWWGVRTTREAETCLAWLANEGHRAGHDPASGVSPLAMFAWDFGRVASVAGFCYAAYLLDLETAWQWMKRATLVLQPMFGSFAEYGQHYLEGLKLWCDDPNDASVIDAQAALARLCSLEGSPFRLPWEMDLAATPAPAVRVREVHIEAGASIKAAIAEAGPGGRVVLGQGSYRESLRPDHAIELCAGDGEVVIESDNRRPVLWVDGGVGLIARGLSLRAGRTFDDKPLNAVYVFSAFARIEECDVSASHTGVFATHDGRVHIVRSDVHDCGHDGVAAEHGEAIVVDSRVHGVKTDGVACLGGPLASVIEGSHVFDAGRIGIVADGEVILRDTRIDGAYGLFAQGDLVVEGSVIAATIRGLEVTGKMRASGTTIEGAQDANVVVEKGFAELHDCVIRGGSKYGLQVAGEARALVVETTVAEHAQGNVCATDGAEVVLHRCKIQGGAFGVWTRGSAGRYADCVIEGASGAGVYVVNAGGAVFTDCVIRDSAGFGIHYSLGASARFSRCSAQRCKAGVIVSADSGDGTTRAVLEDCTVCNEGPLASIEFPPIRVVTQAESDAALPMIERLGDGRFCLRFREHPGVEAAFAARGGCELIVLARAIVSACARAGLDVDAVTFSIDDGYFVVGAADRALMEQAHELIGRLLGAPMGLRAEVDRVKLGQAIARLERSPPEAA